MYPGIDVEYTFHPVEGIKYNLLLHAGADVSKVQMKYSGAGKLFSDSEGNIHFRLKDFEITDHAPQSFYAASNATITSAFKMRGKNIAFELSHYDTSKAIVIDPWTTTVTTLVNNNRAFDIGKDAAGNVYIGGGRGNGTGYKVAKYSSAGTLVWTNNTGLTGYWGDMATDPAGNCYVSEGSFVGNMIKVNSAGSIAWTSNIPNVNNGYEAWALAINDCNPNQLVVTWYDGSYNVRLANLNMATGATTGAQNMGLTQPKEIRSLCVAPNGDVHGLTCSVVGGGTGGNFIFGGNSSFTQSYLTQSGYAWDEVSPLYSASNVYTGCGFNAIVADNCFVYTTNGVTLHKRSRTSGTIISSVAVPGGIFERNGGIAVDSCGNVYVGSQTGVYKFSNALVQTGFAPTPAAVYDVRISSIAGEVLAGGDGFVASLSISACSAFLCNNTIALTVTPSAPVICKDSSVVLTASGAATYTWSPAAGLSSTTGSIVTATPATTTTYTVIGSLTNGCVTLTDTATVTVTINSPLATISSYANASCGANNGTATVTATGGNGSYSYLWSSGQTTAAITNLQPGMYVVTVTSGACSDTAGVLINNNSGLSMTMLPPTQATCGQSNGAASINVTSGNGPYTYAWSNGGSSSTISNLSAGTYSVTVTDIGNCSASATVTINSTSSITLNPTVNHTTCGNNNGSVTVTASGGTMPFSYQWSNSGNSPTISNLIPGVYSVTVSDTNGCSATLSNQVNASTAAVVGINSSGTSVCAGDSLQLCASATYASYSWNTAQTGMCIYAAQGGAYSVTVTDASGCTGADTVNITILNPPIVNIAGPLAYCAGNNVTITANGGVSYLWSNAATTAAVTVTQGSYTVTATDANGCTAAASAVITENPAPTATISGSVTYCTGGNTTLTATGGVSYLWSNAATTAAVTVTQGNYTVTVTDAASCTASASVAVTASSSLTINITGALNYCPGSNTTISASGGGTYLWNDDANSTTASITVTQGVYSVTVTDASGCTGSADANVTEQTATPVNLGGNMVTCKDSLININAGNGYTAYIWSSGETTPIIHPQTSGNYTVTATVANGCTVSGTVNVLFNECADEEGDIYIPNAFTPNGDGNNDLFLVMGKSIRDINIEIFNRWGEMVYSSQNLFAGWDGTYKKTALPPAVYVYVVKAVFLDGTMRDYKGSVTLIR